MKILTADVKKYFHQFGSTCHIKHQPVFEIHETFHCVRAKIFFLHLKKVENDKQQ